MFFSQIQICVNFLTLKIVIA